MYNEWLFYLKARYVFAFNIYSSSLLNVQTSKNYKPS